MPVRSFLAATLMLASTGVSAQQVVQVPQSEAQVSRPDDLFRLPAGQWHFGRQLWDQPMPCTQTSCEGGYTSGDLVVSAEHSGEYVRIMAGFRNCEAVAHSEVHVGKKPGKPSFGRVRKQVDRVVKGLAKTCKQPVPVVASLDAAPLFPAAATP